jgi:hypothetical protein
VAHEALLRKWPWLKEKLYAERVFLIGKQQLEQDLRDWQAAADRDKADALLSGLKLTRARTWLVEHPTRLTAEQRAFVQMSVERDEAEKLSRERRRRNTTRASIAAAIVLAIFAAGAFWQFLAARGALKDAEAAHAQTAQELIRYTWIDLGAQQAEVDRLTTCRAQPQSRSGDRSAQPDLRK